MSTPRRILFVQTAFLGDVVFSTALLRAVAALYPEAEITFLASPRGGGILKGDPEVKEVLLYDKTGRERGLTSLVRLLGEIRSRKFDLVVSPHRSFRSALIARFSGASSRLGFRSGWGRWAYDLGVAYPSGEKRVTRRELRLVQSLDKVVPASRPRLMAGEESLDEVEDLLSKEGIEKGAPLVALIPGTVWPTKKWPTEHFQELGRRLGGDGAAAVVVIGGASELAAAEDFHGQRGVINLVGRTTMSQLVALLSICRVVVAGDTGPLHAAMALGVPVVALFGPTDEEQFEFHTHDTCLTVELDCRPCRPHGSRRCPVGNWRCMPGIEVDTVEEAVVRVLSRSSN